MANHRAAVVKRRTWTRTAAVLGLAAGGVAAALWGSGVTNVTPAPEPTRAAAVATRPAAAVVIPTPAPDPSTQAAPTLSEDMYLRALNEEGLDLKPAEQDFALWVLRIQDAQGGFIANRQDEIRDQTRAVLPRLDREQTEFLVDCVVKIVSGE